VNTMPDENTTARQAALGRVVQIISTLGAESLTALADALDDRLNPPQEPRLRLVQSFIAHRNQEKTPAAGMATAKNGDGVPA